MLKPNTERISSVPVSTSKEQEITSRVYCELHNYIVSGVSFWLSSYQNHKIFLGKYRSSNINFLPGRNLCSLSVKKKVFLLAYYATGFAMWMLHYKLIVNDVNLLKLRKQVRSYTYMVCPRVCGLFDVDRLRTFGK